MKNSANPACYSSVFTALCPPKGDAGSMKEFIRKEVERIGSLEHEELLREYLARFPKSNGFSDTFMRRRLAQYHQENLLGGLDPSELQMLDRIAERDTRSRPKIAHVSPAPVRGLTYVREYKGRRIEVTATGYGMFAWEGKLYKSLTAVVKAVTGTHFSGRKFFGLTEGGDSCLKK